MPQTVKSRKLPIVGVTGAGGALQTYSTATTACTECGLTHADQNGSLSGGGQYMVTLCPVTQTHSVTAIGSVTLT